MHVQARRFPVEIVLVCVRWYSTYGISYRDLAEMMQSVLMGLSIKGLYKNLAGHVSHAGVQNDAAHSGKLAKSMECFGSTVSCNNVEFGSLDNELASGDASGEFTIYHEKTWPGYDESMIPAPRTVPVFCQEPSSKAGGRLN